MVTYDLWAIVVSKHFSSLSYAFVVAYNIPPVGVPIDIASVYVPVVITHDLWAIVVAKHVNSF